MKLPTTPGKTLKHKLPCCRSCGVVYTKGEQELICWGCVQSARKILDKGWWDRWDHSTRVLSGRKLSIEWVLEQRRLRSAP